MNFKHIAAFLLFFAGSISFSQEVLPVYSDYLTDNLFLLHPSMAGASACDKVRLTARQQWFDQKDAPALQTLSYNGKAGDKSGFGVILMNDRNGYHSQKGLKLAYAHHLQFSRDEIDLNQLSFGLSAGFAQSLIDETTWKEFDPVVNGTIVQKANYFNMDFGTSYNYMDFFLHFTVKNLLSSKRSLYTSKEPVDLQRFILNTGYTFGDDKNISWEPSIMFQNIKQTKESILDLNVKVFKAIENGRIWGGLSYRRSFDGAEYYDGNQIPVEIGTQKLQYITPLLGFNYKNFMFAYTYSQLTQKINFGTSGFHQITLGLNLNCRPERYHCNCPAIN